MENISNKYIFVEGGLLNVIDPRSPIVGTLVSCSRPRQTSKEGHLKRTPQPWMTELQRGGQLEENHSYRPKS